RPCPCRRAALRSESRASRAPSCSQRVFHRSEELRRRLRQRAGERAARGVLVAAAAEAMRDGIDGHLALGTEARLHASRLVLAKEDGDLDAADGARIADQVLRVEELAGHEAAGHGQPRDATVLAHLDAPEHLAELGQGVVGTLLVEAVGRHGGILSRPWALGCCWRGSRGWGWRRGRLSVVLCVRYQL